MKLLIFVFPGACPRFWRGFCTQEKYSSDSGQARM